ncbi:tetratricopeptide repeat protein [Amycolatopsis iheyensis]|uniref:tetratricopeptide repeat protein n=1 Tax=Amycolatopsis iheyensis TaxID=2945988 RepID=UPI0021531015|nr:tetratricopeptide repeat protein [Amycolatopsis iheyensis]
MLLGLLVVAAGLALLQKWQGAAWWVVGGGAALATLAGGAGPLWQRWREQRAAGIGVVRRSVSGAGTTVGELSLADLRVHAAVVDVPYLPRPAKEREVGEHLRARRPVLIVGPSMVGKTRLAAAVVARTLPDEPLLLPDTPTALSDLDKADVIPDGQVIWLDDLDRFFAGGLSAGLVRRLGASNWLVATLRAHEWDRFQPTDQLRPPEWDVLRLFELVVLDRSRDRPADDDLRSAIPDDDLRERITRIGIGEYVAAAQRVRERLDVQDDPLGYALVAGAADWSLAGGRRPVPPHLLPRLAAARLTGRRTAGLDDDERYRAAFEWATREINPTVSLLEPDDGGYRVYDYALEHLATVNRTIPTATWQLAVEEMAGDELVSVGYQASVHHNLPDIAEQAWTKAAAGGNVHALHNLGWLHEEQDDLAGARRWYRRAAEAGYTTSMCNLGLLLQKKGEFDAARKLYQQALDAGYTNAMRYLGGLCEDQGDDAGAGQWFRRGADLGDSHAMNELGVLHYRRGEPTDAEHWYRRAVGAGHLAAMNNLGVLLEERGDHAGAEQWYRQALDSGDARVQHNLGWLLIQRDRLTEAEQWLRQAAEAGDAGAMRNLGWLLRQRGDQAEAEHWEHKADL